MPHTRNRRSKSPINKEIGERIRRSREKKGLLQAEVAARVGIKPPSLSQIETGQVMPRAKTLERIADAVGESVSFLLAGRLIGKKQSYEGLVGRLFDKLGIDRLTYLDELSREAAQAMIDQHQLRAIREERRQRTSAG